LNFLTKAWNRLADLTPQPTNKNTMNDLKDTKLKSPLQLKGGSRERKELQDLLALHTRATDPDLDPSMSLPSPIPAPVVPAVLADAPDASNGPLESPTPAPKEEIEKAPVDHSRLFFTGRLMVGKDFCASAVGSQVESFAKPLHFLLEHFFGITEAEKDKGRAFMQTVGQWGRGSVSEKCPLTPERAAFIAAIRAEAQRAQFPAALGVEWDAFGRTPFLWLDAALRRMATIQKNSPGLRVAVTGVRFSVEYGELKKRGWSGWHVMCSPQTWSMRLATKKLGQSSPEANDESEALAAHIDRKVFTAIRSKNGPRLRVIWSDEKQSAPSARLHSLDSFGAEVNRGGKPE
jgi:hypothetical protein